MLIFSLQHIVKAEDTGSMLLKFKAEAKSLRPKGHETKAAEAKIVASRSVWSRVFNISAFKSARESVYFIQI